MNDRGILLVEDNTDDVLLIQRAFRKAQVSCPVHVVNDGEQAVAYLSGTGQFADRERFPLPSLMLLDLKLPIRSGLEVLEWVRSKQGLRRILVVVLTSSKQSIDVERAYDLGANSYLVKPVSPDSMLEMVKLLGAYWLTANEAPIIGKI